MAPLNVLIIGGGIAGPALAYWLSRTGARITLIERTPQRRASGQQVDLRGQGVPLMRKMGIEAAVRAAAVRETGMQLVDVRGRTRAWFPAARDAAGRQSFTSEYEIMRGDLVHILYGLTEGRENVRHLFDTTVAEFTQDEEAADADAGIGKVHVRFHDGHAEDFDLVVGADGTGSRTRKMMLGPSAPDPRVPLGGYIGYFSIPAAPNDPDRWTICHLPGPRISRIISTRKDRPDLTRVYMITSGTDATLSAAHKSGNLAELKKAYADLYQDGGWQCDRFMTALRHAPEADDLYSTPNEEVHLPPGSWSQGRVVLIGDAAHSETAGGYGVSWGLIGAYILAGEIATLCEKDRLSSEVAVLQAVKIYEDKFRPIATATHEGQGSQWFGNLSAPRSKTGIWLLHSVARVAAYLHLDRMAGLSSKTSKWVLPDYPELERDHVQL